MNLKCPLHNMENKNLYFPVSGNKKNHKCLLHGKTTNVIGCSLAKYPPDYYRF